MSICFSQPGPKNSHSITPPATMKKATLTALLALAACSASAFAQATEPLPKSRFVQNLEAGRKQTLVAYGTSLYHPSLDFAQLMRCYHGEDEHLPLASLQISVHFFFLTALRMLGVDPPPSAAAATGE